jgi:EAL domain-containing protein (putative c-di-GMP-specific phosphodiesterase class I)
LLERAHLACCHSKSNGDYGFSRYAAAMEAEISTKYKLELSLHSAVENREFQVYYQPIVDASSLNIVGVEALVRWDHPLLGFLEPDAFLPMAKVIGIAPLIDAWVLTRACLDGAATCEPAGAPIKFHVNVCAATLACPDFVKIVQAALESSGLPPHLLVLEITEQSFIEDEKDAARKFSLIRSMGAKIAIDDFGTGYNGLRYLKAYAVDSIKIDRVFISDVETSSFSRGVCSGIMALAKALNLSVVAEGVETQEQARFLTTIGVSEFQGYLYGRPTLLGGLLDRWKEAT